MKIGFIGLGRMGSAMAANLVKAGHDVTVFNRTAGKGRALVELGAREASTLGEVSRQDVVLSMLADDAAAWGIATASDGLLAALPPGAIHVSMSTISVKMSRQLAAAHAQAGQRYVAGPVFGRPDAALHAKLFIVTAGDPAAIAVCRPLFDVLGQKTFAVGEEPSAANLVKLSGNFLMACAIESLGEAVALVGKAGIDRRAYIEFLTSTLFTAPAYKTYGDLIAAQNFEPAAFAAPLGFKDIRLTLGAGEELEVAMPFAGVLRDRFLRLMAQGGESLDWSAIGGLATQDAQRPR